MLSMIKIALLGLMLANVVHADNVQNKVVCQGEGWTHFDTTSVASVPGLSTAIDVAATTYSDGCIRTDLTLSSLCNGDYTVTSEDADTQYVDFAFEFAGKAATRCIKRPTRNFHFGGSYVFTTTCTKCAADTYETADCTPLEDRQCEVCTVCSDNDQLQVTACTADENTVCKDCGTCEAGKYITADCDPANNADIACATCKNCADENKLVDVACSNTGYDDTTCKDCGTCEAGKYITADCDPANNADIACATCKNCADENKLVDVACSNTGYDDTTCKDCSVCGGDTPFKVADCDPLNNIDTQCSATDPNQ